MLFTYKYMPYKKKRKMRLANRTAELLSLYHYYVESNRLKKLLGLAWSNISHRVKKNVTRHRVERNFIRHSVK